MLNNNRIGYLHFWCQKVLPLVYDNSLSYYEALLKFKNKLNEVIEYTNEIPEYIDGKVKEAFDDDHLKELISEVFLTIEDAITANNEGTNTHFSQDYPTVGTLVWHDNKLYRTMHAIDEGDTIIPDSNIELVNFGDMFSEFLTEVKTRFTDNDDGLRETSSTDRPVHDLVWLNDELYEVIKPIAEGNAYIYSGTNKNVESINLDKIYDYLLDLISSEIATREHDDGVLQDNIDAEALTREGADDVLQGNIDAEVRAREEAVSAEATARGEAIDAEALARGNADDAILAKIGDLDNLPTSVKANIVASINELYEDIGTIPRSISYTTPEEHGAVGDGITDDTAAINAAFNAETTVVFKNGTTYLITDSINIPDGGQLLGNNATILLKAGSDIKYEEATNDRVGLITIKNVSNVLVEKLTIDVNGDTMPVYTDYTYVNNLAIAVENSSNVTIRGCKMINLYTEGIDCHMTRGYLNIEHNYFKHILQYQGLRKDGIYIVTHSGGSVTVNNNVCDEEEIDNQYGCGGIFFANVRNAVCNGNIILNCGRRNIHGHPVSAICVYSECMNIDVCNNYIKAIEGIFRADASAKISFRYNYCSFTGAGGYSDNDYIRFTYYSPSYFGYWGEYTVEGNSIMIDDNNRGAARGIGLGHDLSRPLHSLRIIDNDFTMYNDAIAIYAKMNDIHIKGNRFKGTSSGSHPDIRISDGGDDIFIENNAGGTIRCERGEGSSQVCYHLNIANNSCGTGGAAIKVDNTSLACIHDNCMNGRFEGGSNLYGVIVHDNTAHDSNSGYGYYGAGIAQHDNYYGNALVSSFQ